MDFKEFQNILVENEKRIIDNSEEISIRKSASIRKSYFQSINHSGDLANYILVISSSKNGQSMLFKLKESGYKSYLDIFEFYKDQIDLEDKTSISTLKEGEKYSSIEISCLSGNFNIMKGMYICDEETHPYAIIKATIGGATNNRIPNRRSYDDSWVNDDYLEMKYFLEKESQENTENFSFAHKPNALIFNGLLSGENIPIHIFSRQNQEGEYVYKGIYFANSILPGNTSFSLVYSHSFETGSFRDKRYAFIDKYDQSDFAALSSRREFLQKVAIPTVGLYKNVDSSLMGNPFKNPDYLKTIEAQKGIEDFGENEVLKYERHRIETFSSSLARQVEKTSNVDEGFSIRSFSQNGDPIDINVKTTSNEKGTNPFSLSMREYLAMAKRKEDYFIYRVFDIHSKAPKFFVLPYPQEKVLNFYTHDFLCLVK